MQKTRRKALALAAAATLAACGGAKVAPAKYPAEQCRRVALVDAETGASITGAEDFAIDRGSARLFIAAYDRRAVEKAARSKADAVPEGGVYAASLAAFFDPETARVPATPLAAPGTVAGGLRPHGLDYDEAAGELVIVNRAYEKKRRAWAMTPRLMRIGAEGDVVAGGERDAPCAANDVLAASGSVLTSFDHARCNWRAGLENLLRLKHSGVATAAGETLFAGAAFANGLARADDGAVALAATRENALLILQERSGRFEETSRVPLPGGPDNLTIGIDGSVVAAVHPSLLRLALNRKLGFGKAPSRIVRADPETGAVEILFDDPKGALFSAATVAAETKDGLILGSVTDAGVLVCKAAT